MTQCFTEQTKRKWGIKRWYNLIVESRPCRSSSVKEPTGIRRDHALKYNHIFLNKVTSLYMLYIYMNVRIYLFMYLQYSTYYTNGHWLRKLQLAFRKGLATFVLRFKVKGSLYCYSALLQTSEKDKLFDKEAGIQDLFPRWRISYIFNMCMA